MDGSIQRVRISMAILFFAANVGRKVLSITKHRMPLKKPFMIRKRDAVWPNIQARIAHDFIFVGRFSRVCSNTVRLTPAQYIEKAHEQSFCIEKTAVIRTLSFKLQPGFHSFLEFGEKECVQQNRQGCLACSTAPPQRKPRSGLHKRDATRRRCARKNLAATASCGEGACTQRAHPAAGGANVTFCGEGRAAA